MPTKTELGQYAETLACQYLIDQGLQLVERNFRSRGGELDLIMQDRDMWVFVEVRQRVSPQYGSAAETVTRHKQRRLIKAAAYYLQRRRIDAPCRFDVVAINSNHPSDIDWIKDAFQIF